MRCLNLNLITVATFFGQAQAQFRAYAVEGNLVFALDSTYAVPPKGWFASHSQFYKRRFYNGANGWGAQTMDDRQQVSAPPPTGVGMSNLLESGKDLEALDDKWKVPPSRSRIFARGAGGLSKNSPKLYVVLKPAGSGGRDHLITIKDEASGVKSAEVTELPPLEVLDEIVREQLGAADQASNAKTLGKSAKSLQGLEASKNSGLLKMAPEAREAFDAYMRDKFPRHPRTAEYSLDPLLEWLMNHETDFVPVEQVERLEEEMSTESGEDNSTSDDERAALLIPPSKGGADTHIVPTTASESGEHTLQEQTTRLPIVKPIVGPAASKNGAKASAAAVAAALEAERKASREIE